MTPRMIRLFISAVAALIVLYIKGPMLAALALVVLPAPLNFVVPNAGDKTPVDRRMVVSLALIALALLACAEFLADTRTVRISLVSAAVAVLIVMAFAPLVPIIRARRTISYR